MSNPLRQADFPDTPWSLLARQQADGEAGNLAMQSLLELYWQPVFCSIRDGWQLEPEEAGVLCDKFLFELLSNHRDYTEGSMARFRVFLKEQLLRFMQRKPSKIPTAQTSGIAIDTGIAARRSSASAEGVFDDRWLLVVFRQALRRTGEKLENDLEAYELFVNVDVEQTQAPPTAYQSESLRFARMCFRRELLALVYQYVSSFDEARDELRWLLA